MLYCEYCNKHNVDFMSYGAKLANLDYLSVSLFSVAVDNFSQTVTFHDMYVSQPVLCVKTLNSNVFAVSAYC